MEETWAQPTMQEEDIFIVKVYNLRQFYWEINNWLGGEGKGKMILVCLVYLEYD